MKARVPIERVCRQCKDVFISRPRERTLICSRECRLNRQAFLQGRIRDNLSASTSGAISEMAVSVDLMKKGYAVFRALSPACFCDLIAIKNGKILRIEVRTVYQSKRGTVTFTIRPEDVGRQDIFALAVRVNNLISYFNTSKQPVEL